MRAWKIVLSRFLMILMSGMIVDIGNAIAGQSAKNAKTKLQLSSKKKESPIIGEVDDTDTIPMEDEEIEADDDTSSSQSKAKNKKIQDKPTGDKENTKNKIQEKKRAKLLEGFKQAEAFHKMWYNLPPEKIKTSLGKLTKFCKIACTKKQCMDDEVANNCHLICPASTIKQCPDPLKQGGDDLDNEEVTLGNDEALDYFPLPEDSKEKNSFSSSITSSLEEADKALMNGEEEGE